MRLIQKQEFETKNNNYYANSTPPPQKKKKKAQQNKTKQTSKHKETLNDHVSLSGTYFYILSCTFFQT